MNIIISGWPAAGTTSLSLILAYLLEYKYIYAGGLMKYMAQQAVGTDNGVKYIEFERSFGPYFDIIWEPYARWKVTTSDKLMLEAKTAGFFIEDENVYEIMVIADLQTRTIRAQGDKRKDNITTINARDQELRQRWIKEFQVDLFNEDQVLSQYDLVLDNSKMTIEEELETTLRYLEEDYRFPEDNLSIQRIKVPEAVNLHWQHGKDYFRKLLYENNQYVLPEIIIKELKYQFPDLLAKLPASVKSMIDHIFFK